ncbi:MAG TPA: nucleotidyltransferase family protein [Bryobacteraceae bacterium]|nr:nucleotidyltransferase family protein [Bryobacteraceae bacterium]
MSAAGLILAAGESRRMGSPKALLPYRGATFLDTLIALFTARCEPVIVVLGAGAGPIRAAARHPATFVVNADWALGMTTSLQCGLRAVPPEAEGVLFTLVDHPAVSLSTIETLLAPPRPLVRVPRYGSERGHPIWFSRALVPEFLAIPLGGAANEVVHRHRAETEFLDLDDAGVVADIDDPEAYRRLTGARV